MGFYESVLDTSRHVQFFGEKAELVTAAVKIFIRLKNDQYSSPWKNRSISCPDM